MVILGGLHKLPPYVVEVVAHQVIVIKAAKEKCIVSVYALLSKLPAGACGLNVPVTVPVLIRKGFCPAAFADNVQRLSLCCCKVLIL